MFRKYPFETTILFSFLYYSGVVLFLEANTLYNKFIFIFIALGMLLLMFIFSLSFRDQLDNFNTKFLGSIKGKNSKFELSPFKILNLVRLSLLPFLICSVAEFLLTFLFTKAGGITFGFPLPFYSFSAGIFLPLNLTIDIFSYTLILIFVGISANNSKSG